MVTTNPACHLLYCTNSHLLSWLKPKCHPFSLSDTHLNKTYHTMDWWSHHNLVSWQVPVTENQSHVVGVRVTLHSWLMPSELTETAHWGHFPIPSWLSQSKLRCRHHALCGTEWLWYPDKVLSRLLEAHVFSHAIQQRCWLDAGSIGDLLPAVWVQFSLRELKERRREEKGGWEALGSVVKH